MKKIFILLSIFVFLFISCETDFDVNAEWKETTVVYGLLDASADTQYIKINKAYLGEGDAMMMAQYSDSINFNPNDLEVKLHKLGDTLPITLVTTTLRPTTTTASKISEAAIIGDYTFFFCICD